MHWGGITLTEYPLYNKYFIHNIFFIHEIQSIMVLSEKMIDEILSYLEKSINNLAIEAFENLEIEGGFSGVDDFLQNQFDLRLENLLIAKKSSIHHLESGMKNKVIQRKQRIFDSIAKRYEN